MEEKVGAFASTAVLRASTHIREEICGPVAQKVQHAGADGGSLTVKVLSYAEEEAGDA
jgi:hypothetical protein